MAPQLNNPSLYKTNNPTEPRGRGEKDYATKGR